MTRLAAHRGGARLWPENSLRAFRESLALGVDLLELDVHLSADGQVVVIHDALLDRTTNGQGTVGERTAAELVGLRLRDPDGGLTDERVPTLEDVLVLVAPSRAGLLVEVKGPVAGVNVIYERGDGDARITPGPAYAGLVGKTLALLRRHSMLGRVNVMGFSPEVITEMRALEPAVPTTFLVAAAHVRQVDARPAAAVAWATRLGATDLGIQHTLGSRELMKAARAAQLRVGVWTVNDEEAMRRAVELGVDVLTTDRPDLACRVLGR